MEGGKGGEEGERPRSRLNESEQTGVHSMESSGVVSKSVPLLKWVLPLINTAKCLPLCFHSAEIWGFFGQIWILKFVFFCCCCGR